MAQYKVKAPDGEIITLEGPEGASQEEIIAQAQRLYQPPTKAVEPPMDVRSAAMAETGGGAAVGMPRRGRAAVVQPVTPLEATAAGVFKGAVLNPALAVTQVVGGEGGREYVKGIQDQYRQTREQAGLSGIDIPEIAGSIVSPINRLFPAVTAAGPVGRIAQYGTQGAIIGALTPAEEAENLLTEKLQQVGTGALFGGVLSGALDLGKGALGIAKEFVKPITTAGQKAILQQRLLEMAGKEPEKIISALRNAPELVPGSKPTASEALADIPVATSLAAFQKSIEKIPTKGIAADFAARRSEVEKARKSLLRQTGGTQDDLIEAIAKRTEVTDPLREDALYQANIYGQTAPKFEQQIAEKFASKAKALQIGGQLETEAAQLMRPTTPITDFERRVAQATGQQIPEGSFRQGASFYPVEGMPAVPLSYRPEFNKDLINVLENLEGAKTAKNVAAQKQAEGQFKKLQLQSLAENGFYPLRVSPIIEYLDNVLQTPGLMASDVVKKTFTSLKDKLISQSDPVTGIADSRNLYTIRKEIGNDVKRFSKETENWDVRLTGGLVDNVKSYIDNAIEKAGNSGDWKKYRDTFQQESIKINQMQIMQALEKQLGTPLGNAERVAGFAAAVENAPNLIKRSTGQNRFQSLDKIMTKKQMDDIDSLLKDVSREAKGDTLASLSRAEGQTTADLPNLLNRYATATNTVLKLIKKDAVADINRLMATMSLNTPLLADFMQGVPPSKAEAVVKALWSRLTPENREALNRALIIKGAVPQMTEGE